MTQNPNGDAKAIEFERDGGKYLLCVFGPNHDFPARSNATPADIAAAGYVPAAELEAVRLELEQQRDRADDNWSLVLAKNADLATERARAEEAERRLEEQRDAYEGAIRRLGERCEEAERQRGECLKALREMGDLLLVSPGSWLTASVPAAVAKLKAENSTWRAAHGYEAPRESAFIARRELLDQLAAANARAGRLEEGMRDSVLALRDGCPDEAATRLKTALSAAPQASAEQAELPCPKCTSADKFCSLLGCIEEDEPVALSAHMTAEDFAAVSSTDDEDPTPAEPQGRPEQAGDRVDQLRTAIDDALRSFSSPGDTTVSEEMRTAFRYLADRVVRRLF
jgi:hypothetical protein